jgi:hypothetical protein
MARETEQLEAVVRAAEGVVAREFGTTVALFRRDSLQGYGLDDVGARIWRLLQASLTVDEIVDRLVMEYDVDRARCREDVLALLQDMESEALVVWNRSGQGPLA